MADTTSTRRRVKLYMLNEERQWDDQGTGHVSSIFVERLKGMSLQVRSETDGTVLLESKIQPDTMYQKQQETLIVWSEAANYDLALSFQEQAGCLEIWRKICQVQGKDPSVDITQDCLIDHGEHDEEFQEDSTIEDAPDAAQEIELPPCELSKLEEIWNIFTESSIQSTPIRKEKLSMAIENSGYIKKLLDLFHMCEDLDNMEGLHHLYEIFKNIFLLNRNELFEIMFSEETIFDVIGVLEHQPSSPQPSQHRTYLKETAKFKQVVPMTNKELLNKIHQTYRVQYIQDVILPTPSVFEENHLSSLTSFIFFNKVEIVSMIQEDEKFLSSLFTQLTSDDTEEAVRRDLVLFLKEFCTFSQTLQQDSRESFFKTLSSFGVLSAIEVILGLDDPQIKSAAIDIFSYIVEFSPSTVREFIMKEGQKQDDDDLLVNLVIDQMINDPDPELGGALQLMGVLKLLIDPENMIATSNVSLNAYYFNKTEKSEFLVFFYKHSMHVLTAPLYANTSEGRLSKDDFQSAQLQSLILELLTFCIEHHTFHIKNYIISKDLLRRVLLLLKSRHRFLALCALRFMRKIVGIKDDFYYRYIIKGSLFKPIVEAFIENGTRYNLFNSAIIELFEFIKMEDIKSLCAHIVETHMKELESVNYVSTFNSLKMRYEQQQDGLKDKLFESTSVLRNHRYRRDARTLEEEEEMWFDEDDETEDLDSMVPVSDVLRSSLDADFDHINRYIGSRKVNKDQSRESPPRLFNNRSTCININLRNNSPNTSPVGSPATSPTGSPTIPCPTPNSSPITPSEKALAAKRAGLVGLVDYPDEDSDEEEEDSETPTAKRPRLAT
ncbi:serine/threonine-protein phosphatase 4 regulatory subunit 3A-like isoform X1 [Mytilus edulis]|uniref:Protein phosphatase 4 regulatory subunit 3 n=1 Tax=Mytilus galloprovincialis TaxID=29158 RepID=A0A8B6E9N5_MYTGA|nr:protein phosphatase 4 regulatory subunit 3 [Mytilus galloprovincialis]